MSILLLYYTHMAVAWLPGSMPSVSASQCVQYYCQPEHMSGVGVSILALCLSKIYCVIPLHATLSLRWHVLMWS